jgi:uncharacterized protein
MRESRYNIWVERENAAYVFNGLSGALLRIPKAHYRLMKEYLAGDESTACPPRLLVNLAEGLMLVLDDSDELMLLNERYQAGRDDSTIFCLTIVTSLGCNFNCSYCFEEKHASIMKADIQERVIDLLCDRLPSTKNFSVSWYGGEPLLAKNSLFALSDEFINHCDRADVAYNADITTNGYLLDEETCVQLHNRRVQHAQVTLDGPPEIHNRMRPLVNQKGTFWRIVENLHHAVKYLEISIRVNLNKKNFPYTDALLQILANQGFVGKLSVYPGQITQPNCMVPSPLSPNTSNFFTNAEFANAKQEFLAIAQHYGFYKPSLPPPIDTPCTAVRVDEVIIGSKGELYKCWESVGDQNAVVGNVSDYQKINVKLRRWLNYNPFANPECRRCKVLPFCMGGCPSRAMKTLQYRNRCSYFRYSYREQINAFIDVIEAQVFARN